MKYMPQLDSIRAIAVIAVMAHHYKILRGMAIDTGEMGVSLFFVLSGFLITTILLKYRRDVEAGTYSSVQAFQQFYLRRTIRIFPIYYITVAAICILGWKYARETFFWNVAYLSNIKPTLDAGWNQSIAHFWSLSVEEQFYLLWPWMIFFTPRRHLLKSIVTVIVLAPLSRLLLALFLPDNPIAPYALTCCCLDFLGFGGLLALFTFEEKCYPGRKEALVRYGLNAGAALFLVTLTLKLLDVPARYTFLYGTCEALFYVWLISRASEGIDGLFGFVLKRKLIVQIGKISYGIYLFHPFIGGTTSKVARHFGYRFDQGGAFFLVNLVATVVFASCSWVFLERPINNLKGRFRFEHMKPAEALAAVSVSAAAASSTEV